MGFSCFLCRKPFQEVEHFSEKGGGDGQMKSTASATTCGHLFHTDCLQTFFNTQSLNAWAPKTCPVCTKSLDGLQDIIRVRAYPFDDNGFQRPAIDDLNKQLKQIQAEKADVIKQFDSVRRCNEELRFELDSKKREFEELGLRYDQLIRLNKVQVSDLETYKLEIEKLKNIVIKLTEKITGDPFQDNEATGHNGMQNNVLGRVMYGGDYGITSNGGYDLYGSSSGGNGVNFNSGSQIKHSNLSCPPGFMLPFSGSADAGQDLANSSSSANPGSQQSNIMSSLNQEVHKLAIGLKGQLGNGNAPPGIPIRSNKTLPLFARSQQENGNAPGNNNVVNEQNNRNSGSRASLTNENNGFHLHHDQPANQMIKDSSAGVMPFKVSVANINAAEKSENGFSPNSAKDSSTVDRGDLDYDELDSTDGKWYEKTSRNRRGHSRIRGSRSSAALRARSDDKRYGYFKCETCKAEWGSSKSVLNQPQTCRYCKTEVHPYKQDFILSRKQLEINKKAETTQKK